MRIMVALLAVMLPLLGQCSTGQEIAATTSGRVTARSDAVPRATITVVSTAKGFRSSQTGIELSVNDSRAINHVLEVKEASEEIRVEADPLQVNLHSPAAEGLISGAQV